MQKVNMGVQKVISKKEIREHDFGPLNSKYMA